MFFVNLSAMKHYVHECLQISRKGFLGIKNKQHEDIVLYIKGIIDKLFIFREECACLIDEIIHLCNHSVENFYPLHKENVSITYEITIKLYNECLFLIGRFSKFLDKAKKEEEKIKSALTIKKRIKDDTRV